LTPRGCFLRFGYLKMDPQSRKFGGFKKQVKPAQVALYQKFQPNPSARDLTSEDYCLVEGFSGDLLQAQTLGKQSGLDIEYVIPEEGGALWVDGFAIPQDATHVDEAHAFLNFVLRPDIIAKVTNAIATANSVPASLPFVEENIRTNPLIYPSKEIQKKLYVDESHSSQYERKRRREWVRVISGW
jgi:putrescine transport system substrate-binding protein